MANVTIDRGTVIVYRVFDVAEELDLARIQSSVPSGAEASRLAITRPSGHALVVRDAPITISLGPASIRLGATALTANLFARAWSYGVVSIQFHLPIESGTSWDALVARAALVEDDNDIDAVAAERVLAVAKSFEGASNLPHEPQGVEDYVVYFLEQVGGVESPADLLTGADVPALILGEPHLHLAEGVRQPILESALSYATLDLAVVDWNSALVIDPSGSRDVADILEFALTHLTEFRYFDALLDARLENLYDAIEERHPIRSFFWSDYGRLSHEASTLFLEFSEYVERIENSLKFVGDFFLATVFRRAAARFQLREWEESVTRKVDALARVSEVLSGELNVRRSHLLEIVVIALILYEIVSAAVVALR